MYQSHFKIFLFFIFIVLVFSSCTDQKTNFLAPIFFDKDTLIIPEPTPDTLKLRHFPPDTNQHLFYVGRVLPIDSGWVFGTNIYYDKGYATSFTLPSSWASGEILEIRVWFGYKKTGLTSEQYNIKIYSGTSSTGPVGSALYSQGYLLANVSADNSTATKELPTIHKYLSPISVERNFFVSVDFGSYNLSGIQNAGILSTDRLGRNVQQEWKLKQNGTWQLMSDFWYSGSSNGWNMWIEVIVAKAED